jgi:hypothetical protein
MRLYLTITSGYNEVQVDPAKSLGGYKSISPVDNDFFGNFFGEITSYAIQKNQTEYIALILRNDLTISVTNVKIWIESPIGAFSAMQSGLQLALSTDTDGNKYMEYVSSRYSKPLYATLSDAVDEATALSIGTLIAGQEIGLWIKRSLLMDVIVADQLEVAILNPATQMYDPAVKVKSDSFEVKIKYTTA